MSSFLCKGFLCLQFGFVIFWQKDFGTKAAYKMLVKLLLMSLSKSRCWYSNNAMFHWTPWLTSDLYHKHIMIISDVPMWIIYDSRSLTDNSRLTLQVVPVVASFFYFHDNHCMLIVQVIVFY
jgi:hypothetical protein